MKVKCDICGNEHETGKEVVADLFGPEMTSDLELCDACYATRKLAPRFWGNEYETGVVLRDGRIYLIQSADLQADYEELRELPADWQPLDPSICQDLVIPEFPAASEF